MNSISVVVPSHNAEQTISRCLLSVIEQEGVCIEEIIVSDNASADSTLCIVKELQKKYQKIRIIERSHNIGACANFLLATVEARGEYVVLCGSHDMISPNYIQQLFSCFKNKSNIVLAMGSTRWIDDNSGPPASLLDTSGMSQEGKFVSLLYQNQHYIYGMIRRSALLSCWFFRSRPRFIGADELVLQELASMGDFAASQNAIWYRGGKFLGKCKAYDKLSRYRLSLFSSKRDRILFSLFPSTRYAFAYMRTPFKIYNKRLAIRIFFVASVPLLIKLYYCVFDDIRFLLGTIKKTRLGDIRKFQKFHLFWVMQAISGLIKGEDESINRH